MAWSGYYQHVTHLSGSKQRHRPTAGLMALVLLVVAITACGPYEPEPENLLIVTLDTLRADHLGSYGYLRATSPNLDQLAEESTLFTDVTCSIPTTLPSHLTIFTGLSPAQHGVTRNGQIPDLELPGLFRLLTEAHGWRKAAIVATGVLQSRYVASLGLEEVIYEQARRHENRAEAVTDRALAWLDAHGRESFALWVHYFDPHEPYDPPAAFAERFSQGYGGPLGASLSTKTLVGLNDPFRRAPITEDDLRHIEDLYDAEIAYMDAHLGRLLERATSPPLGAKTLIVVVGDHGQALGENGRFGHGEWLLEPIVKVPLLIRLPDQSVGQRVQVPVETLDILPTLAQLLGFQTPPEARGQSLVPLLLAGEAKGWRKSPRVVHRRSYLEHPERRGVALHGGSWKLTFLADAGTTSFHLGRTEGEGGLDGHNLFDPNDPDQLSLGQLAQDLAINQPDQSPVPLQDVQMLKELGYTN